MDLCDLGNRQRTRIAFEFQQEWADLDFPSAIKAAASYYLQYVQERFSCLFPQLESTITPENEDELMSLYMRFVRISPIYKRELSQSYYDVLQEKFPIDPTLPVYDERQHKVIVTSFHQRQVREGNTPARIIWKDRRLLHRV